MTPRHSRTFSAWRTTLIVRNGTIVDGLGGEPFVGDVAIADGVIAAVNRADSTAVGSVDGDAVREIDATGLLVTPGLRRPAHPLRRSGHLVGPDVAVVGPRCDDRGDGQLRCRFRAVPRRGPRRPGGRDGRRRGHSRRRDGGRAALDLGDVPRVPGHSRLTAPRYRRSGISAAFTVAGLRDGPARCGAGARDRRGPRADAKAGDRGDRGGRAGVRVVAAGHPHAPTAASRSRATTRPRTRSTRSPAVSPTAAAG